MEFFVAFLEQQHRLFEQLYHIETLLQRIFALMNCAH